MKNRFKVLLFTCIFIGFVLTTFSCGDDSKNLDLNRYNYAELENGAKIKGIVERGVNNFRGIPYAKQPVNERRFAPPVLNEIKGEFDATEFGPVCPQPGYENIYEVSEGCLILNIQTPKDIKKGEKLPVYFWIHGGWFMYGNGNSYDGSSFVKNNIVYVSINYRLNIFGFLATSESYEKYGTTGNLGFLDQVCALKWVKKNIEAFGGDPDNITVGGESAGSYSASGMLISEKSKGLAKRVVLESGTIFGLPELSGGTMATLDNAIERTNEFFIGLGITNTSLDYLRKLPTNTLVKNLRQPTFLNSRELFLPTLDGKVFPKELNYASVKDQIQKADCLIIHNTEEGRSFVPEEVEKIKFQKLIDSLVEEANEKKIFSYLSYENKKNTLFFQRDVAGLLLFLKGQAMLSYLEQSLGGKTFVVNFGYLNEEKRLDPNIRGTSHASELKFVFSQTNKLSKNEQLLAQETNYLVSNFIKNGEVVIKDSDLKLEPYTKTKHNALLINEKGFKIIPEPSSKEIDFIDELLLMK